MNQTAFKDADINTAARNLAKEYNFKGNRLTQLEMDFVAFAYNYNQSRLSAILTKIEERIDEHKKTKGDSAYMDHDYVVSHAKIQEANAVKSLIEEELE